MYVLVACGAGAAAIMPLLGHLLHPLGHIGLIVLFVAVVAFALAPAVRFLERRLPRALAAVIVFVPAACGRRKDQVPPLRPSHSSPTVVTIAEDVSDDLAVRCQR